VVRGLVKLLRRVNTSLLLVVGVGDLVVVVLRATLLLRLRGDGLAALTPGDNRMLARELCLDKGLSNKSSTSIVRLVLVDGEQDMERRCNILTSSLDLFLEVSLAEVLAFSSFFVFLSPLRRGDRALRKLISRGGMALRGVVVLAAAATSFLDFSLRIVCPRTAWSKSMRLLVISKGS